MESNKQKLKNLFPHYSEIEINKILEYLNTYDVNDKLKIQHIENLYKLMHFYFSEYIGKSW